MTLVMTGGLLPTGEPEVSPLRAAIPDAAWHTSPATWLEAVIAEFKTALPGWWFSLGECQVSCDASCGPTRESPYITLAATVDAFDSGFHADLLQPSTMADALRDVMEQALEAIAAQGTSASGHDPQGREAKPAGPVHEGDAPC